MNKRAALIALPVMLAMGALTVTPASAATTDDSQGIVKTEQTAKKQSSEPTKELRKAKTEAKKAEVKKKVEQKKTANSEKKTAKKKVVEKKVAKVKEHRLQKAEKAKTSKDKPVETTPAK